MSNLLLERISGRSAPTPPTAGSLPSAASIALAATSPNPGLLADKGLRNKKDWLHDARVTARARSLTVLSQLSRERKRSILQFLYEGQLINEAEKPGPDDHMFYARIVGLSGADLTDANLRYITLEGAALDGAILENVDLRDAKLSSIDLGGAYLSGADLRGANLCKASLREAHLQRKDKLNLRGADLRGADLSGADLSGANLADANLKGTRYDGGTLWPEGFAPSPSGAVDD